MKLKYRSVTFYEANQEIAEGSEVRILDRFVEKVFKPEDLNAVEYVHLMNSKDYDRYDFWVIEVYEEDNNEEVMKYVND